MRVLFASHGYPPTVSGPSLIVQKLARALVRRGHEVAVMTASEHGTPYQIEDEGVMVFRLRSAPNPRWKEGPFPMVTRRAVEHVVTTWRPDIIHSQDPILLTRHLQTVVTETGLPMSGTCHYVPSFAPQYLPMPDEFETVMETFIWGLSIRTYNRHDAVVFANQSHRALYTERGLTAPTRIISNGIDTQHYRPDGAARPDIVERYGLPAGRRVLFVGRLMRDKQIDLLIEAIAKVDAMLQAHLLLAGRGPDRPRLEALVKMLTLQERVHFLGFVPEQDLAAIYQASDLFAIAATYEVQSLPTLQAMATGIPVVAANAVSLPELVHDDVNGILVPPYDPQALAGAMATILENRDLAERMGKRGLELAQDHDNSRTIDGYESLFQDLLQERRRSS